MIEAKGDNTEIQKPDRWFGIRHVQYVLFFTVALSVYAMRTAFTVAVIAMISENPPSPDIPTYPEWASQKNVMLSSFFWGYITTQIIAGQVAERFGPKWLLAGTILLGSLFNILLPTFGSAFGYEGVIACRVLLGMTQGMVFPCLHNLMGKWCPIVDRAKACGFAYAGVPLGIVVATAVTGPISNSIGWPASYYIFGGLGIVWCFLWAILGSNCPSVNRLISASERNYILAGVKSEDDEKKEKVATPWIAILTTLPFWAILINDCGQSWGYWTLLTEIPSFMQNILKFDIEANGLISAIPQLLFWLLSMLFGLIADYLILKKYTSIITSRKIFNSIAMFVPAVALVALSFVGSGEKVLSVTLLVIAAGCTGGIFCGYLVSHIDLSPNYAGTLLGIANTVSNVFSLLAPLYVDAVIHTTGYQETDDELWTIVFCTAAGMYVFVGIVFILLGSADVQPWNSPEYVREKKKFGNRCLI